MATPPAAPAAAQKEVMMAANPMWWQRSDGSQARSRKVERPFELRQRWRLWPGLELRRSFVPRLEAAERDDAYVLVVDLPGLRREDVEIRVEDGNVLTILGERRQEMTSRSRGNAYSERSYGRFSRSIELPRGVDATRIEANMRDGVLEIHLPRNAPTDERGVPIGTREIGNRDGARGDGARNTAVAS